MKEVELRVLTDASWRWSVPRIEVELTMRRRQRRTCPLVGVRQTGTGSCRRSSTTRSPRAPAGAAHQARRSRDHQDDRRRRHRLGRQAGGAPDRTRRPGRSSSKAPSPATRSSSRSRSSRPIAPPDTRRACWRRTPSTPRALLQRGTLEGRRVTWTIDKARGVARLEAAADISPAIELPLRPMLGCLGVAPARKEAIATSTPGAFGGNMDYAGLNAGVKVMLAGQRTRRAAVPRRRPRPPG